MFDLKNWINKVTKNLDYTPIIKGWRDIATPTENTYYTLTTIDIPANSQYLIIAVNGNGQGSAVRCACNFVVESGTGADVWQPFNGINSAGAGNQALGLAYIKTRDTPYVIRIQNYSYSTAVTNCNGRAIAIPLFLGGGLKLVERPLWLKPSSWRWRHVKDKGVTQRNSTSNFQFSNCTIFRTACQRHRTEPHSRFGSWVKTAERKIYSLLLLWNNDYSSEDKLTSDQNHRQRQICSSKCESLFPSLSSGQHNEHQLFKHGRILVDRARKLGSKYNFQNFWDLSNGENKYTSIIDFLHTWRPRQNFSKVGWAL